MAAIQAYVDGAHIDGKVGYGAVVLHKGEPVKRFAGPVDKDFAAGTRNVAGELAAVGHVLNWCQHKGIEEIELFYDYEGIEKWARGRWKTKQPLTKRYAAFVRNSPVRIHFRKVKAHTGDKWNDEADRLAKAGALKGTAAAAKPEQPAENGAHSREALRQQLTRAARSLVAALNDADLPADFEKLYQTETVDFARIRLRTPGGESAGRVDLYHSRKKPYNLKVYAGAPALRQRVEEVWARRRP